MVSGPKRRARFIEILSAIYLQKVRRSASPAELRIAVIDVCQALDLLLREGRDDRRSLVEKIDEYEYWNGDNGQHLREVITEIRNERAVHRSAASLRSDPAGEQAITYEETLLAYRVIAQSLDIDLPRHPSDTEEILKFAAEFVAKNPGISAAVAGLGLFALLGSSSTGSQAVRGRASQSDAPSTPETPGSADSHWGEVDPPPAPTTTALARAPRSGCAPVMALTSMLILSAFVVAIVR